MSDRSNESMSDQENHRETSKNRLIEISKMRKDNLYLKLACFILVISNLYCMILANISYQKLNKVDQSLFSLQNQYQNISSDIGREINTMKNQFSEVLEGEASLIASARITVDGYEVKDGQLPLTISVMPKELKEDMTATFIIKGEQEYIVDAKWQAESFVATVPMNIVERDLNIVVKFKDGSITLFEELEIRSDFMGRYVMHTGAQGELVFRPESDNVVMSGEIVTMYDPLYKLASEGAYDTTVGPACYPEKGDIIVYLNENEFSRFPIEFDKNENDSYYSTFASEITKQNLDISGLCTKPLRDLTHNILFNSFS